MNRPRIVVVGDAMLDRLWWGEPERLCPDTPAPVILQHGDVLRPGGAALAALFAADLGGETTLITALGTDRPGRELAELLTCRGIDLIDLGLFGPTPQKIRLLAAGHTVARLDRDCQPVAGVGSWSTGAEQALTSADAVLVSDYGRLLCSSPRVRTSLTRASRHRPVLWDPHPASAQPPQQLDLVTPNLSEARTLAGSALASTGEPEALAALLSARWNAPVAVTLGPGGAVMHDRHQAERVPSRAAAGDPCGAGDRLAAAAAVARGGGHDVWTALRHGVASATEWVAGATSTPRWFETVTAPCRRTRVAAGGCFDLLHAGHVRLLEAARRLGDELVVCLNSDASVRRLKGPSRPVNTAEDRAAVLRGLGCVDRVEIFDEDTPCEVLDRLRPDIFVKGGDYDGTVLPEADVLRRWGGRLVLVDLVEGRSTTQVLARAIELASA